MDRKFFVDRAADGELAALALSVIRSQSVASVLSIIVSERNSLTPASTPAQRKRSRRRPGLTMTRERLEHPAGQSLLLEQTKLSLEAGYWTYEIMGNVGATLLQLLFRAKRRVLRERRRCMAVLVAM